MLNTERLRNSLVVTWLATAFVSAWEWHGRSVGLLQDAGIQDGRWQTLILALGVALDVVVGLALWLRPGRWVYRVALLQVLLMSAIATWLLPALWLHPLGPLLKNIPILAALRCLDAPRDSR